MKCILFDLDGTLLPMEGEAFTKGYFEAISRYTASKVAPEKMIKAIWKGTEAMIANDTEENNMEVFKKVFLPDLQLKQEEIFPQLNEFYLTDFKKLIQFTNPNPFSKKAVQAVLNKGYQIVLATNALFPWSAVMERMKWAGVDEFPWLAITDYEITKGCKPNLKYYQHIVDRYSVDIESSWMVGNDVSEDMIAKEIGFKTYLITDCMIDKGRPYPEPDRKGSMEDFLKFATEELVQA